MKRMIDSELLESLKKGVLKPIAEYRFANGILTDYGTFEGNKEISILGLEDNEGNYQCIGLGYYTIINQEVENFVIIGYDYNNDDIMHFSLENDKTISASMYAKSEDMPFLYRHKLRLNNLYILMYDSSSNLTVDSVDGLRTIMNITSNSDRQVLPVCTEDGTTVAPLAVTMHYCKINGTDVTTVSDVVTTL